MRKQRNYADFWRSLPMEEPYRVVLAEVSLFQLSYGLLD